MPTIEAELRRQLLSYAVELRELAYTLPNGIGEHNILGLSECMHATADHSILSQDSTARHWP